MFPKLLPSLFFHVGNQTLRLVYTRPGSTVEPHPQLKNLLLYNYFYVIIFMDGCLDSSIIINVNQLNINNNTHQSAHVRLRKYLMLDM